MQDADCEVVKRYRKNILGLRAGYTTATGGTDTMTSHLVNYDLVVSVAAVCPSSGYTFPLSQKFLLVFHGNDVRSKGSREITVYGPSNVAAISGAGGT